MSLVQLLAVGRSLETIKDEPSRYRMTQHLLPKFGPPARPETKTPDAVATHSRPVVEEQRAPFSQPEPQAIKKNMNPLHTRPPAPSGAAMNTTSLSSAFPLGRWTRLRRNPFGSRPQRPAGTPPVQGELRLDLVRPVRNDLSDADLEVVEAPEPVSAARESEAGSSIDESHRFLWSRLTARIFGAGSC